MLGMSILYCFFEFVFSFCFHFGLDKPSVCMHCQKLVVGPTNQPTHSNTGTSRNSWRFLFPTWKRQSSSILSGTIISMIDWMIWRQWGLARDASSEAWFLPLYSHLKSFEKCLIWNRCSQHKEISLDRWWWGIYCPGISILLTSSVWKGIILPRETAHWQKSFSSNPVIAFWAFWSVLWDRPPVPWAEQGRTKPEQAAGPSPLWHSWANCWSEAPNTGTVEHAQMLQLLNTLALVRHQPDCRFTQNHPTKTMNVITGCSKNGHISRKIRLSNTRRRRIRTLFRLFGLFVPHLVLAKSFSVRHASLCLWHRFTPWHRQRPRAWSSRVHNREPTFGHFLTACLSLR